MAERNFTEFQLSLEKRVVHLFATFAFSDGSGAGAMTYAKGVASIAKDGATAGQFLVTLADKYKRLLACHVEFIDSAVPLTCFHSVKTATVATTKIITLNLAAANRTLTDPAATATMKLHIVLANSDAP